jgi:hypothetical protein
MDAIKGENGKSSWKRLDELSEQSVFQTEVESIAFSQAELLSNTAQAVTTSASYATLSRTSRLALTRA